MDTVGRGRACKRHERPALRPLLDPLTLAVAFALASCATDNGSVKVVSTATGTPAFSLGAPGVYAASPGLLLAGRVCRRARNTLLSPTTVRIERIDAAGAVTARTDAILPPIYRRTDQACAAYSHAVSWTLANGESLRACFERGTACPVAAESHALVAVPPIPPPSESR